MIRYAQIDENGIVISDSQLGGAVEAPNMIPISEDFNLKNKRYINGEWFKYEPEPIRPEPISDTERTILETAINTEYLVCLAEINNM